MNFEQEITDENILRMLPTQDGKAMELMFRKYYSLVCQNVVRLVKDHHVSEDLAQEVFMDVWRKRNELIISTSLQAYLRRAGLNKALNYIRDKKIRWDDEEQIPSLASASHDVTKELEGYDLELVLHKAIDALPERCRVVFTLSRFEEMSYQQIADELGISIKTVENQMTKALKMLRAVIQPHL